MDSAPSPTDREPPHEAIPAALPVRADQRRPLLANCRPPPLQPLPPATCCSPAPPRTTRRREAPLRPAANENRPVAADLFHPLMSTRNYSGEFITFIAATSGELHLPRAGAVPTSASLQPPATLAIKTSPPSSNIVPYVKMVHDGSSPASVRSSQQPITSLSSPPARHHQQIASPPHEDIPAALPVRADQRRPLLANCRPPPLQPLPPATCCSPAPPRTTRRREAPLRPAANENRPVAADLFHPLMSTRNYSGEFITFIAATSGELHLPRAGAVPTSASLQPPATFAIKTSPPSSSIVPYVKTIMLYSLTATKSSLISSPFINIRAAYSRLQYTKSSSQLGFLGPTRTVCEQQIAEFRSRPMEPVRAAPFIVSPSFQSR
ncbi:hypothetical protein STAS_26749 [Striga asiatica]|uniref:Uncharacterized protein n=1 Tax=Striga asiatica TaxID=4170 RepID=A0A5A7QW92_STRAF|nr:hypothetical protein STAS_26749 [Striga asiatica]